MDALLMLALVAIYFVPSFIAFGRNHHQRAAILATNLLLGWSGLGWAAAFIWACTAVRPHDGGKMTTG